MPTLRNPRHEKFAEGLAAGKTQEQAYIDAGFSVKHARSSAARLLKRNPEIDRRVNELIRERRGRETEAASIALQKTAASKEWILGNLVEIVMRCMQRTPVLDHEGKPVLVETPEGALAAAYAFDPRNATAALRLLAIEQGLCVQRHEVSRSPLDGLPPDFVREIGAKLKETLQRRRSLQVIDGELLPPVHADEKESQKVH